jgi:hypothetical protein
VTAPVEALCHVGLEDVLVLLVTTRLERCDRLVTRTSWTAAVAVGLALRLPCRCPGEWRPGVAGAIRSDRHPSRPVVRRAWWRHPDAAYGLDLRGQRPGLREAEPLGRWAGCDPLHSGSPVPPMVLRASSGREALGGPGRHHESLELVDRLDVAMTPGAVEALVACADRPCDGVPRAILPCLPRTSCRVHAVCTPTGPSPFHPTGRPAASPRAFPEACAAGAIPPHHPAYG